MHGDKRYWLRVKKISQELRKHNLDGQLKDIAFEMCEALHKAGVSEEQIQQLNRLCFAELKKGTLTKSKFKEIWDFVMKGSGSSLWTSHNFVRGPCLQISGDCRKIAMVSLSDLRRLFSSFWQHVCQNGCLRWGRMRKVADMFSNQGRKKEKPDNISQEQGKSIALGVWITSRVRDVEEADAVVSKAVFYGNE